MSCINSGHLRQSRTETDGRNKRHYDGSTVDDINMTFAEKSYTAHTLNKIVISIPANGNTVLYSINQFVKIVAKQWD
jgi:hypothetical protein